MLPEGFYRSKEGIHKIFGHLVALEELYKTNIDLAFYRI